MSTIFGHNCDDAVDTARIAVLALYSRKIWQEGVSPDVIMTAVAAALDCDEAAAWVNGRRRLPSAYAAIEFGRASAALRRSAEFDFERRTRKQQERDEYAEMQAAYRARHASNNVVAFTPRPDSPEGREEFDEGA